MSRILLFLLARSGCDGEAVEPEHAVGRALRLRWEDEAFLLCV